jgi:predicted ester cyclase
MDRSGRAEATVLGFFDAHRDRDVERMAGCCAGDAELSYVPLEWWGRQRVVRGEGTVRSVGKALWTGLFEVFPDATNEVVSMVADGDGNVAAEVVVSGTQAGEWGTIGNRRRRFSVPHLFVFRVADSGLIERVAAYWDDAALRRQLGAADVD